MEHCSNLFCKTIQNFKTASTVFRVADVHMTHGMQDLAVATSVPQLEYHCNVYWNSFELPCINCTTSLMPPLENEAAPLRSISVD